MSLRVIKRYVDRITREMVYPDAALKGAPEKLKKEK